MKQISRKNKLILTGIALLLAIVGTTYAWWTAKYEAVQEVTMGNLKIVGDFPELTDEDVYEPGTTVELNGTIKNAGSISAMIKIENGSQIKFQYSDDLLTPIPANDQKFVEDTDQMVQLNFEPESGLYNDPNSELAFWFTDKDNNTYLLLDPSGEVKVNNIAAFSGEMGNKYQDSIIKVGAVLKATQVMDGALQKEFGVTSSDLKGLEDGVQARSANQGNRAENRLKELVNR